MDIRIRLEFSLDSLYVFQIPRYGFRHGIHYVVPKERVALGYLQYPFIGFQILVSGSVGKEFLEPGRYVGRQPFRSHPVYEHLVNERSVAFLSRELHVGYRSFPLVEPYYYRRKRRFQYGRIEFRGRHAQFVHERVHVSTVRRVGVYSHLVHYGIERAYLVHVLLNRSRKERQFVSFFRLDFESFVSVPKPLLSA